MALTEKLTNIADAIREKTGGTEKLSLDGMAEAIAGISAGGGDEQSVLDSLIDKSITEVRSNAKSIGHSVFRDCSNLTTINFPLATSIGDQAFTSCFRLASADFPLVTSIGNQAFYYCKALTTVNFPLVTALPQNVFYSCEGLTSVNFPLATSIPNQCFYGCKKLAIVDLPSVTSIVGNAFRGCRSLKAVILRSDSICSLGNVAAFYDCYHFHGTKDNTYNPDGLKDGYFYVPAALIENYKAATNWSTFATQFRALEDYTVDGTTTGALDESKI